MTLIAGTLNFSYPIVLGDLLATSPTKKANFKLPTFLSGVEQYLPDNIDFYPARLVQKTYIIKPNLVVAIAGSFVENKEFIKSIKSFYETINCTEENINEFISQYDQSKFINSAYLILFYEKKDAGILMCPITIGSFWQSTESELFEEIFAIGSGSADFIAESKRYSNLQGFGSINNSNRALSLNMILLSGLLALESFSLETIKKYWGAGFELITYDETNETFYKLDEFTYIIWRGKLDLQSKELQISPYLVLSYKYVNDILIISSSSGDKYEGFGILPIYLEKEDVNMDLLPKEFKVYDKNICNTFILELSDGTVSTPSVLLSKNDTSLGAVFINFSNDKGLEIGISEEITNKITADLIEMKKAAHNTGS